MQLHTIRAAVWIVDGDRDTIKRSDTDHMAPSILLGSELSLPFASHFALWEYPGPFDRAVRQLPVSSDARPRG